MVKSREVRGVEYYEYDKEGWEGENEGWVRMESEKRGEEERRWRG